MYQEYSTTNVVRPATSYVNARRTLVRTHDKLEMWINAQRDGRPAEYGWRPLFNAAVWLTPNTGVP